MKEKLVLLDKTFRPYIPHERIIAAIDDVAEKVNADFRGCRDVPMLLCVLNGAIPFTGELLQRLDFNCAPSRCHPIRAPDPPARCSP